MLLNQVKTTLDSNTCQWENILSGKSTQQPTSDFIDKLKTLDLGPIAHKLMHPSSGNGWSYVQTQQAIAQYLMFLCLVYYYPQKQLVPTLEIDKVWHQHILDTQKYAQDCEKLFGRFIHHYPYIVENEEEKWYSAFADTQTLLLKHFGFTLVPISGENFDQSVCRVPACKLVTQEQQQRPSVSIELNELFASLQLS